MGRRQDSPQDGEREATCVVIDSRRIEPGGIFIAARGENADGHSFIPQVAEKGALWVVCEREPVGCDIPYILVRIPLRH